MRVVDYLSLMGQEAKMTIKEFKQINPSVRKGIVTLEHGRVKNGKEITEMKKNVPVKEGEMVCPWCETVFELPKVKSLFS